MYRKFVDQFSKSRTDVIYRESDNACIPCDPANKDYVEYLAWAKQNNVSTIEDLKEMES